MAESQLGLPPVRHGLDYPDEADWRSWFSAWRALFHWEEETLVEIYPTVKDFLLSVKRIGAGNAGKDSGIGFQSRKLFAEMETRYASMFGCKNGIRATYQAGYGIFRSIMAK
jgi:malonyl-CoA O-methyltransferase